MQPDGPMDGTDDSWRSPRRLGLVSATAVVASSMMGVGAFATTGLLLRDLGSTRAVLCAWALGGLLAFSGALSYAELGAVVPENGGEYRLLSRIFHPGVGFVAGFVSFFVGFSAPLAAVSLAFGRYLSRIVPGVPPAGSAIAAMALFSVLHSVRVSFGRSVHSVITALEVALVLGVVAGGLRAGVPARLSAASDPTFAGAVSSPAFAVALVYVAFSYSGWNAAAYVAGEIRNPERVVPRALALGTGLVTLLYLGLNTVFLMSAPAGELSGVVEVGHVAAVRLFGSGGGQALSGLVALCLFGSVGAQVMTGARVYEAMGRDYPRLRWLATRRAQGGPFVGMALQTGAAAAMVLTSSFEALLAYVGFTLSLSSLLTVVGVFVLRFREPELERPYRTTGYPFTPLLAAGIFTWMLAWALVERPLSAAAGLVTLAAGAGLYFLVAPRRSGPRLARRSPEAA